MDMKLPFLLLLFISSSCLHGFGIRPPARSLKSFSPHSEDSTELVALLNGTIYLEDKDSGKLFWSFSSGSPIYSSYHHHDASSFFVDYGDDWHLYAHVKHSTGMKLSMNIEEFIKITPHIAEDGAVILGSKTTSIFVVEANTGTLIRSYTSLHSPSRPLHQTHNNSTSSNANQVIYITRTDYALQTFAPNSDKVSWNMKVAVIEAAFLCNDADPPPGAVNSTYENDSQSTSDFENKLLCQSRRLVVRRQSKPQSSSVAIDGSKDNLMLPSQPLDDIPSTNINERRMLPQSAPNNAISLQPKRASSSDFDPSHEGEMMLALPNDPLATNVLDSNAVSLFFHKSTALPFFLFIAISLLGFVFYHHAVLDKEKVSLDNVSVKASSSKRKKNRKSGTTDSVEMTGKVSLSDNGNGFAQNEEDKKRLSDLNKLVDCGASGRRIGKLLVIDTEIAKGSNGTIVLEGIYGGRPVAVKRLVQAHHDVAFKEIQNLIASDRHPNIVRWYGVEYDKDFVYLSLERCTCSLDDLMQICCEYSLNTAFSKDQVSRTATEHKLRLDSVKGIIQDFNFWKANGHPSPLLLTLMQDVVSGLAHLHELGIVHRDLKPQNVLIVKERSLCAKLSDMGISKRLIGDMSSLGHHATGCGSSGWQAPEQLLHGRQTRAVDLFSLGCVLFFCITGGKHPFGDRLERDINIVKNQMDLFLVENIAEAEDLISQLLNPDPNLRPKAWEVLNHPMFWNSERRLSFLRDTSDRVELENRASDSDILKALENIAPVALGGKWDEKMEAAFISNIGHYRRYKFDSVRDLLRVMRNKLNHYRELPREIQELVGPVPDGYDDYFASRFPKLLIEVYKVVCRYCREEESFQKYFNGILF